MVIGIFRLYCSYYCYLTLHDWIRDGKIQVFHTKPLGPKYLFHKYFSSLKGSEYPLLFLNICMYMDFIFKGVVSTAQPLAVFPIMAYEYCRERSPAWDCS